MDCAAQFAAECKKLALSKIEELEDQEGSQPSLQLEKPI